MYDFNKLLNLENVLKKITPYQIFRFYIRDLVIGSVVCSPIRRDSKPSFGLFVHTSGEVLYKDFATNDVGGWTKFVQKLFNLNGLNEVLKQVNKDMQLGLYSEDYVEKHKITLPPKISVGRKAKTIIKTKYRN